MVENPAMPGVYVFEIDWVPFFQEGTDETLYPEVLAHTQGVIEERGCKLRTFDSLDTDTECQVVIILAGFINGQPRDHPINESEGWLFKVRKLGGYLLQLSKDGYGPFHTSWHVGYDWIQWEDLRSLVSEGWGVGISGFKQAYWRGVLPGESSLKEAPYLDARKAIPMALEVWNFEVMRFFPNVLVLPAGDGADSQDVIEAVNTSDLEFLIGNNISCTTISLYAIEVIDLESYLSFMTYGEGGAGIEDFYQKVEESFSTGPVNNCP